MIRKSTLFLTAVALLAGLVITAPARASADYRTIARLFGSTTLKGKAVYKETNIGGSTRQDFKVEVENGVPAKSYGVRVNGALVSTITLNVFGRAELEMRTAAFIDDTGNEVPLPEPFPRVSVGDLVTVGPLSGVFFDAFNTTDVQRFRVEGDFVGPNSINGSVKYQERFKNGGLERRFDVEVEDATPGQTFNVRVKGKLVGQVVIGALGIGELELRTAAFIDSPDDGIPMPDSFPSLKAGDTVTIGSMTTVLVLN